MQLTMVIIQGRGESLKVSTPFVGSRLGGLEWILGVSTFLFGLIH